MKLVIASATFGSTHRLSTEGPHLHGHTFHVSATETALDSDMGDDLPGDLRAIVGELHLRSLDDMLIGGNQTLDGIAAWLMERLLVRHPGLSIVEVWTADRPDFRVGVRREVR